MPSRTPDSAYTVHADIVGTSVFQPGTNADAPRQVAMGLVGVLIVTPAGCAGPNMICAYDGAQSYSDEALVATTDLDYDFATNSPNFPAISYFGQPMNPDGSPRRVYHVLNGKSFPDTDVIDVRAGDSLLIRSVNAGVTDKSMSLLGLQQSLLGRNASKYADAQLFTAPLVGPGETADLAVQVPGGATPGQRYALVDAGRQMNNGNGYGFGGALTFLNVWPNTSPTVDSVSYVFTPGTRLPSGIRCVDRAYATDLPAEGSRCVGARARRSAGHRAPHRHIAELRVVEPGDPGGSTMASAGEQFHAYVLRPTGTGQRVFGRLRQRSC